MLILRNFRRWASWGFASFCLALLLALPRPAFANVRYLPAMKLLENPSDPQRTWLMTTYGLPASTDRAQTWSWICEDGVGLNGNSTFEPSPGVFGDGCTALAASLLHRIRRAK